MPYRVIPFINEEFYHLYNRGLEKKDIFTQNRDYSHFIKTFFYYQIQNPKPKFSVYRRTSIFPVDPSKKIVDIICYCLMPNHFHLLIKQLKDGGITEFMRRFILSYIKYRNLKYKHQGPLLNGPFRAVRIETDEQLIHVSRYIHLNPLVSKLVKNLNFYSWSSYRAYIGLEDSPALAKEEILSFFKSPEGYQKFVMDQADYGTTLELLKHTTMDIDE
ncbi:transposase [Candidatus Microgenomates bacterium]|nr:transposase [Candidatus Microgenomates bacterium]